MIITSKNLYAALALAVLVLAAMFFATGDAEANTPGEAARHASSSTMVVGPQEVKTLFADTAVGSITSLCASRVISTVASPVMLSFSSAMTPSGIVGHYQAASTTVSYPADTFGCEAITAYGFASSTITKSEFRW